MKKVLARFAITSYDPKGQNGDTCDHGKPER